MGPARPWQPPPIPSGYYDPALDAQRRAAQRGYVDFQQDVGLAGSRSAEDYGIQTGDIRQQFGRSMQDLGLARQYEGENYGRSTGLLGRQFGILANQQRQRLAQSGVLSGGIALLAAQKRAANQAVEQQGLDIAHTRALTGFGTQETRLGENLNQSLGAAGLGYTRGVTDRATQLARAGRENTSFGLDVEAEKAYQAQQAGYVAPTAPTNRTGRAPAQRGRPPLVRVGRGPAPRLPLPRPRPTMPRRIR